MNKNGISDLIQTGDLFDNKREVQFSAIKEVNEYFFGPIKQNNISAYVISGNHDILYKNTSEVNSISLLCPDYIKVVDKVPVTFHIGHSTFDLYPWINASNLDISVKKASESKSDYAIGHFEFSGFPMYPGTIAESGMSHKIFKNYKKVFSGHFHTISTKDNIIYTGTPYELNFTDCGDLKGFWILDTETGLYEHVKNPYQMYSKIFYTDDTKFDFSSVYDKIVKLQVVSKESQKKFDAFVSNVQLNKPFKFIISDSTVAGAVSESLEVTEVFSTQTMIENVIDTLDVSLDKKVLKNYILETYSEAINLTKV